MVRPQELDEKDSIPFHSKQIPVNRNHVWVTYSVPYWKTEARSGSGILHNPAREKIYTNNHILCEMEIRTDCLGRLWR